MSENKNKYTVAIEGQSVATLQVSMNWLRDLHSKMGDTNETQLPGAYDLWSALDDAMREAGLISD